MAKRQFNRAAMDVGNIIALEHVNLRVPDQALATFFYVNVLGFTRDPYMDWGPYNVWVNVGGQQFHLPTGQPQTLRGLVGVVVPDLAVLNRRLHQMQKRLEDTDFVFKEKKTFTDITCPWGNHIRAHGPGGFGEMQLGIPYVEFHVPHGTATGIGKFYRRVMGCGTQLNKAGTRVDVSVGVEQRLRFKETPGPLPDYDGHHIAIYVASFSGPHRFLKDHDLITEESDENQYRFQTIVNPDSGRPLFEIEHEVRSLHHPMYQRALVNRNSNQSFFHYQRNRDAYVPAEIHSDD